MRTLICPTCSCSLLRKLQTAYPTWFCPQCHQEFPYGVDQTSLNHNYSPGLEHWSSQAEVASRYLTPQERHQLAQHKVQKLEKLNFLKDYFLNAISHELYAPLNHIQLALDVLSDTVHAPGTTPEEMQAYINVLQQEFDQQNRLINSLITLQQVKAGLYTVEMLPIGVSDWINSVVDEFREILNRKSITFALKLPDNLPLVEGDRSLLNSILREILSTTIHLAPQGSEIQIHSRTAPGRLEIQVTQESPGSQSVESLQGHHSSPGTYQSYGSTAQEFTSFQQISTLEPWLQTDISIGLILAQNLVASMGGVIWVGHHQTKKFVMLELPHKTHADRPPTPEEKLMGYVAYYVSRGRPVISPWDGELTYTGSVYSYWGYDHEFYGYWRGLQRRRDFQDLCLRADHHSFGEFLHGAYEVHSCARCQLPIVTSGDAMVGTPNCPCDEPALSAYYHQLSQMGQKTRVLVLGSSPQQGDSYETLFARNRLEVTFIESLEDLQSQETLSCMDLVILPDLNPRESQQWMQKLRRHPSLQKATFLALSPHGKKCQPWIPQDQGMVISQPLNGLLGYLLTPYGGDYLAQYLQQAGQDQGDTSRLHWFPGVS